MISGCVSRFVIPVFLIDSPLVIKRGGHADQLSRSVWGMDRFRVLAIAKLLRATALRGEKRQWALDTLRQKTAILAAGAGKGGNSTTPANSRCYWLNFYKEPGRTQTIQEYSLSKGFHPQFKQRWLNWKLDDGAALLDVALSLRAGENHLRDLMDWLEEIALRDGVAIWRNFVE